MDIFAILKFMTGQKCRLTLISCLKKHLIVTNFMNDNGKLHKDIPLLKTANGVMLIITIPATQVALNQIVGIMIVKIVILIVLVVLEIHNIIVLVVLMKVLNILFMNEEQFALKYVEMIE